jgi:hypothetical protein
VVNPHYLEVLSEELRRRRVPRRYARRVTVELADHLAALRDEIRRNGDAHVCAEALAQARLGDPRELADEIADYQARRGFVRRHALVIFLVLPAPAVAALVAALALLGRGIYLAAVNLLHVDPMNPALRLPTHYAFYGLANLVTPLAALALCRLAARHRLPLLLPLFACVMLSLAGGFLKLDLVHCLASGSVKYFQRYGPDPARMILPLAVFAAHSVLRLGAAHVHVRARSGS